MTIKIFGAILVMFGCAGFGIMIAATHRNETTSLRDFLSVLNMMECELRYRLTPLPELCRLAATASHRTMRSAFMALANELEDHVSPNVENCMIAALHKTRDMPKLTLDMMKLLGRSLGRFDLEGQLKGLESVKSEANRVLESYTKNQDVRLRCYQTLGICAGAAIAILFI